MEVPKYKQIRYLCLYTYISDTYTHTHTHAGAYIHTY
jgi:hypothetical protein